MWVWMSTIGDGSAGGMVDEKVMVVLIGGGED